MTGDGGVGNPLGVADPLLDSSNGPTTIGTKTLFVGSAPFADGQVFISGLMQIGNQNPDPLGGLTIYARTSIGTGLEVLAGNNNGGPYRLAVNAPMFYDGIGSVISPTALPAGNTNDYDVDGGGANANVVFSETDAAGSTITGLDAAAMTIEGFFIAGKVLRFCNIGPTGALTFAHQSASSLAANRLILPGGVSLVLPVGSSTSFIYDDNAQRWRYIQ